MFVKHACLFSVVPTVIVLLCFCCLMCFSRLCKKLSVVCVFDFYRKSGLFYDELDGHLEGEFES